MDLGFINMKMERIQQCHEYLDNRLFESLGHEEFTAGNHFLSPILSFYEQEHYARKDKYFNMDKHSANPYGEEKEARIERFKLTPYRTLKELQEEEYGEVFETDTDFDGDF